MNCSNCDNNYLLKIFDRCMEKCGRANESLTQFDRICLRTGDPRSPLTILKSMYHNTCDECNKYRKYYIDKQ